MIIIKYIYKIWNEINNKVYIGKTSSLKRRWNEHKRKAQDKNFKSKSVLYDAMNKYGINYFHIDLIEECEDNIVDEREIYYISYFNTLIPNGYNLVLNDKFSVGENNIAYKYSDIIMMDLEGNIIEKFHNIFEASNFVKSKNLTIAIRPEDDIRRAINKKTHTAFGYVWRLEKNKDDLDITNKSTKAIIMMDKNENEIKEFKSLMEAVQYLKSLNITSAQRPDKMISAVARGKYKIAYGYKWKFKNLENTIKKIIIMNDLNDNFVKEFNSITEAGKYIKLLGLSKAKDPGKSINAVTLGKRNTAFGFKWYVVERKEKE